MLAKEWMLRAWKIEEEIGILKAERQKAFSAVTAITTDSSKERAGRTNENTSETKLVQYIKYCVMLDEKIEMLYKIKTEIFSLIEKIENSTYRTLLVLRYIQCKSWKIVAEEMNYSTKQISRIHEAALCKIQAILDKKAKKV